MRSHATGADRRAGLQVQDAAGGVQPSALEDSDYKLLVEGGSLRRADQTAVVIVSPPPDLGPEKARVLVLCVAIVTPSGEARYQPCTGAGGSGELACGRKDMPGKPAERIHRQSTWPTT